MKIRKEATKTFIKLSIIQYCFFFVNKGAKCLGKKSFFSNQEKSTEICAK